MIYEILDTQGNVENTIVADEQFMLDHYPEGNYRQVTDTPVQVPAQPWEWLIDIGTFFDRFGAAKMAVLTSAVRAHAAPPPEPAESFTLAGQTLVLNGSGTRHKAVFKVYNAHLYLPHKAQSYAQIAQMPGAKRLEIHMLRDIDANELGKLFTKGIEHNTPRQHLGRGLPRLGRARSRSRDRFIPSGSRSLPRPRPPSVH